MKGSRRTDAPTDLMRFAHLGALGLAAIGGGFWLGMRLDTWLGTSPWLSLVTALLGALGWMLVVVREAQTLGSSSSASPPVDPPGEASERESDER